MTSGEGLPDFGSALFETIALLVVLCVVAWLLVRVLGRRRGVGRADLLRVVASCRLDGQRWLYVVEMGGRRLLLGASEGGITKLAEIPTTPQEEAVLAKVGAAASRARGPEQRAFEELLADRPPGARTLDSSGEERA